MKHFMLDTNKTEQILLTKQKKFEFDQTSVSLDVNKKNSALEMLASNEHGNYVVSINKLLGKI